MSILQRRGSRLREAKGLVYSSGPEEQSWDSKPGLLAPDLCPFLHSPMHWGALLSVPSDSRPSSWQAPRGTLWLPLHVPRARPPQMLVRGDAADGGASVEPTVRAGHRSPFPLSFHALEDSPPSAASSPALRARRVWESERTVGGWAPFLGCSLVV